MKKKIGFWMLLSFVLFSCAKEQEPEQIVRESGQAGPEAGYASLNAAIEADDDTRNSLEDADGKRYLLWSEGEIIGVTGNTSGNARASLETGFGGKASGTFWYNSEVVKGGVKYGYYPYTTDAYVSGTTLNVTLPDVQPYKEGSMIADNVLVMAGRRRQVGVYQCLLHRQGATDRYGPPPGCPSPQHQQASCRYGNGQSECLPAGVYGHG